MVDLPPEAAELARKWSFRPLYELPGGHCSRVYADAQRVLKVPFQGEEAATGWKMALQHSGSIGPQVHEHDPISGALLMERLNPGTKLSDAAMSDDECMALVLNFGARISTGPIDGLMPLEEYFSNPNELAQELIATTESIVALHGDLHHENILLGERGWVVIDPKGLAGDPAFELAAFMRNPIDELAAHPNLRDHLRVRLERISRAANADPWRVWGWSVAAFDGDPPEDDPWHRIKAAIIAIEPGR